MSIDMSDAQVQAQDNLIDAVGQEGVALPCWDRDEWTSDDRATRRRAAEVCKTECPVVAECFVLGKALGATAGVYGGQDFTQAETDLPESKVCTRCGEVRPAGAFYVKKRPNGEPFLPSWEKACVAEYKRERQRKKLEQPTHKVCTGCQVDKPIDDFHRMRSSSTGRKPRCKDCVRAYERAHRAKGRVLTQPPPPMNEEKNDG